MIIIGDCLETMKTMESESIDALVTDPPAGIGFMGKAWDGDKGGRNQWVAWLAGVMREALRVLKPGAHALVWALPRTSHWTATALEDAGFEVRDVVMHLFGTGVPKSLTDKSGMPPGQGTALKPAAEHWILCRKPIAGTVAKNVAAYGTGGLNIDACRIEGQKSRWPAHLTLDEGAAALLDAQSGTLKSGLMKAGTPRGPQGLVYEKGFSGQPMERDTYADSGGASRFFYVAKPSTAERDAGCEHLPAKSGGEATDREDDSAGVANPRAGAGRGGGRRNFHPTVKPIALMRWLCRLITPPGGVVLDPFAGSGTTGAAALAEGFQFIGCEQSAEYAQIAEARIAHAKKQLDIRPSYPSEHT